MKTERLPSLACATLLLATLAWLAGCSSEPAAKPGEPGAEKPVTTVGAAQLWAENCSRCHNTRSPSSYSDAQWDVIGDHMRVRGYLTGEEQRTIVEFLKAGN